MRGFNQISTLIEVGEVPLIRGCLVSVLQVQVKQASGYVCDVELSCMCSCCAVSGNGSLQDVRRRGSSCQDGGKKASSVGNLRTPSLSETGQSFAVSYVCIITVE